MHKLPGRKKIVIVGGGSVSWSPTIVKDMMLTEGISNSDFVLLDINLDAAKLVAAFLHRLDSELKTGARFIATDKREHALEGADYVVVAISTGGLDAMAKDLKIPESFGIYHTVGDTSGPGGWARFFRNYPVFVQLAKDLNRLAPNALVLNYTNPMTTLTAVLAQICKAPVVGLCHGLFENLHFLKTLYGLEGEEEMAVRYLGLNHFFWITEIRSRGRDLLADLRTRVRTSGLTDMMRKSISDPMGFKSDHDLATELFRETGVMPYIGDRHTCEFFPGYITNKKNMEAYKLVRTTIPERRRKMAKKEKELRRMIEGGIPADRRTRSRETAADIIAAHALNRVFIDVGNVPNIGQISNLPLGTVVETPVVVDARGFTPVACGALPGKVVGLVEPWTRVFDLSVKAAFQGDRDLALHALRLDPVCSHLSGAELRSLGEALIAAHKIKFQTLV